MKKLILSAFALLMLLSHAAFGAEYLNEALGAAPVQMNAGDVFVIETPGGGGFGHPSP